METLKTKFTLCLAATIILVSVSWIRNNDNREKNQYHTVYDQAFSEDNSNSGLSLFDAPPGDEFDWAFNAEKPQRVPPADDVRIQKIPGDNSHVLVMALYAKASFKEKFFTVNHGGEDLLLRDDGIEYDKVAGDGVFTAKVFADVNEVRSQAIRMLKETKANNWEPLFVTRDFKYSTLCDETPFSEEQFDKNEAVSISNLAISTSDVSNAAASGVSLDKIRANSIFVNSVSVVEDKARTWNPCAQTGNLDGAWTFKTIMKNLATQTPSSPATDQTVSDFVKKWLESWSKRKIINSDSVEARTLVKSKVLDPWLSKSLAAGNPSGFLDMKFAPFKLTAIVNRMDLRTRSLGIPVGEGRLIFCLINSDCTAAENMTVIFEYGIPKTDACDSLQKWATQWYNLGKFVIGTTQYNSALQAITDQFTKPGTSPNKIHQSSLNAVRTAEVALTAAVPPRWEFREFGISGSHQLAQRTISQAPADKFNKQVDNADTRLLAKYVNDNQDSINLELHTVPLVYEGVPFRAGKVQILDTPVGKPTQPYHWDGAPPKNSITWIDNGETRHLFSRFICSGCHSGEMQTFFTHADPVFFGTQATLSGFLTGRAGRGGAVDADNNATNNQFKVQDAAARNNIFRIFNDIKRRAIDTKTIAETSCTSVFALRNELMFKPVGSVH